MRRILGRNATQGRARENVSQAGETKTGPSALSLRAGDQTVVMKLASLLFFALLIYVHQVCSPFEALDWPLSAFREGECEPLGYALFGAIALVTAFTAWTSGDSETRSRPSIPSALGCSFFL
jgi:hypothetical protein